MLFFYTLILLILSIYSYALIDPNITFFQHPLWVQFRDPLVYFGYYERQNSWLVYVLLVIALFIFHFIFVKKYSAYNPLRIAFLIGGILLVAYPFLSHDFFNYMFDAKIFTYYHMNPYTHTAFQFPEDQWRRFMHWQHRSYPYGPVFLLITFIPSFLSMGKFAVDFFLFKLMFIIFYILAVYFLQKNSKKQAMIFATHPLVLIEGLVSSHIDLIMVCIACVGLYYLSTKRVWWGRLLLLISGGVKFITVPLVFLTKKYHKINVLLLASMIAVVMYVSLKLEIQPWYFLVLFLLLPYYEGIIDNLFIFFAGLLFSYYPYIRLGGWDTMQKIFLKREIIFIALLLNAVYLGYLLWKKWRRGDF